MTFRFSFLILLLCLAISTTFAQKKAKNIQWQDIEKQLQTQMIMAEPGEVIEIPAGHYKFKGSIWLDEGENITIKGAGREQTILSFAGQTEGAEGIKVTSSANITIQDLTVQDTKGDAIKVQKTDGITFQNVGTIWTGKPKEGNGAYGFYPVQCSNVLIEECLAIGASDAGIYVGQSKGILVKKCTARYNVAGIEIENSIDAEVTECLAENNTGGILVFDMPNLMVKNGGNVKVHHNVVRNNNYKNFAPEGNIVGKVPPGTGFMVMGTSQVEIYENTVEHNKTFPCAIISWYMTQVKLKDTLYNPYPTAIYIHDNTFEKKKRFPTLKNDFGKLMFIKFGRKGPDIVYDGIINPDAKDGNGGIREEHRICIRNNSGATFANIDAENDFENISRDLAPHDCERVIISPVGQE